MRKTIKAILKRSPIPFSKNHRYDLQTKKIIRTRLSSSSNCIDVGCHKGEILDLFLQAAPNGHHVGFEPIPQLFTKLQQQYGANKSCTIYDIALSNQTGTTSFNYVISNPSYSGLIKRNYDRKNEEDTVIQVNIDRMDNIIHSDQPIDLIKIDVEGGELLVLEGAKRIIKKNRPLVIFEHGLGASEFYESSPEKIFAYFADLDMKIATLSNFLHNKSPFTLEDFKAQFYSKLNYYFIAFP